MGVLVGRIGKIEEERLQSNGNKLVGLVKRFLGYAENYGLAVTGREVELRKDFFGNSIFAALEGYGVATCEAGVKFWR